MHFLRTYCNYLRAHVLNSRSISDPTFFWVHRRRTPVLEFDPLLACYVRAHYIPIAQVSETASCAYDSTAIILYYEVIPRWWWAHCVVSYSRGKFLIVE